ncbi:NACHT domain-containing protein [Segatella copri]|uniref:NACHT domain-containing protein n=1 Tax=Segatella copri TaxID=165179 RepID=UPI001182B147|nr:NACHT domain-containing protein [Segatella copri]
MEEVLIAVAAKSLVEGFIKNYALPKLSKLAHSISKEGKANLSLNSNAFIAYYKRAYNNYSIINTLAFKERVKKLKDIYIPLTIYPVDNKKEKKLTKIEGYPKELLDKYSRILITDTAGMGKSTLMKRMFLDVIDGQFGIPIFIELRRLNENNDILNEVAIQLGGLNDGFDKEILETLFVDGEFIFFFDGYDEISSSNKAFVTRNIQDFVAKASNNKYILTSRPEEELACFGEFQEFRIRELKKVESYDLLRKYDISGKTSRLLISKLETGNYSMINEFLKNPLLVSLLFAAFDFKQTIPLKKHIFYRQVFDAYFDSHDLSKGDSYVHEKKSNLDLDDFDKVMRKIGYECLRKQKIEFEKDELLNIIDSAKSGFSNLNFASTSLLGDLLKAVPLFCQDGMYYKWVHKSLQEYFAAEFIYKDSKNNQDAILTTLYKSKKIDLYINLLDLYFDIDPVGFQKNIVKPLLESYVEYYEKFYFHSDVISSEAVNLRLTITYCNRVLVGFIDNKKDQTRENFDYIYDQAYRYLGSIPNSAIFLNNGSFLAFMPKNQDRIIRLLGNRVPSLFVKVDSKERCSKHNIAFEKCYELEGMKDFSDNPVFFTELNQLLSSHRLRCYLDINKVKAYLAEINAMLENSYTSEGLLGGL